jgi:hypothetical protein
MRFACLLIAIATASTSARAQGAPAPTYQRMRTGAEDWQARGGPFHGGPRGGFGGFYNPYFNPYFAPPIAGSYYQRPYPYHFDYYRFRWNAPSLDFSDEMMPVSECPCLAEPQAAEPAPVETAPTAPNAST